MKICSFLSHNDDYYIYNYFNFSRIFCSMHKQLGIWKLDFSSRHLHVLDYTAKMLDTSLSMLSGVSGLSSLMRRPCFTQDWYPPWIKYGFCHVNIQRNWDLSNFECKEHPITGELFTQTSQDNNKKTTTKKKK